MVCGFGALGPKMLSLVVASWGCGMCECPSKNSKRLVTFQGRDTHLNHQLVGVRRLDPGFQHLLSIGSDTSTSINIS